MSPPRKKGDPDPPPLPPNGDFKNPGGFKTKEEADEWNEKRWKYIIGRWDNFFADYTLTCTFTYNDKPVATGVDISAAFSTNKEPQKDPKSGKSGNHPSGGIDASKLQDALAAAKKPPPEWNDIESLVFKKKDGGGGGGGDIPVVDDAKEPVKFVFPGHKDKDGKDDYDKAKDNPNDKGSPDDPDPAGRPPK